MQCLKKLINKNWLCWPIIIFSLYFILAIIFTYPLFFKLNSIIWGAPGDNSLLLAEKFQNITIEPQALWPGIILTGFLGEAATFNFLSFLSFPLSGLTMYWLAKFALKSSYFTGKSVKPLKLLPKFEQQISLPAFFAGFVFAFSPYHFWQSYHHFTLGQIQWLPLFFLALLVFLQKPTFKNSLLLGTTWLLNFFVNLHYGFFTLLLAAIFTLVKSIVEKKLPLSRKSLFPFLLFGGVIIAAATFWQWQLKSFTSLVVVGFARPLDEIFALSARPWDFLIPAPNHFFLGKPGQEMLDKIWRIKADYRFASPFLPERVIYLGIVPIIFSCIAIFKYVIIAKAGIRARLIGGSVMTTNFKTLFFTFLIIFLLSLPPFFDFSFGRVYFPNFVLAKLLPQVRVYARIGIIVLMLITLIASLGLEQLIENWKFGKKYHNLLILILCLVLIFEFLPFPNIWYKL